VIVSIPRRVVWRLLAASYEISSAVSIIQCQTHRTMMDSKGVPMIPAIPPAMEPAKAILAPGAGPEPRVSPQHLYFSINDYSPVWTTPFAQSYAAKRVIE